MYSSNPIVVPEIDPGCKEDRDCPSKHACIIENGFGTCLNPCLTFEPCARNARCEVHDELPLRVMSCTCLPGFTGKGDVQCDRISKDNVDVFILGCILNIFSVFS